MKNVLMVTGIVAVMAFGLAGCGPHNLDQKEAAMSQLGALKYSSALGGTFLSCSGIDSEPDGYVTCNIKTKENTVTPIACSYESEGCKAK